MDCAKNLTRFPGEKGGVRSQQSREIESEQRIAHMKRHARVAAEDFVTAKTGEQRRHPVFAKQLIDRPRQARRVSERRWLADKVGGRFGKR